MMRGFAAAFLLALTLPAGACRSRASMSAPLSPQDVAAIKATLAAWRDASVAGDWPAFFGYFTDDAVWMSPYGPPIEGLDNLRKGSWFRATEEELVPVQIEGSGDLAFARGTLALVLAQQRAVKHEGTFLTILRRQGGAWKMTVYSFSF